MTDNTIIVVPCYNEENRLPVEAFDSFLDINQEHVHFMFVDDGSSDNTFEVLTTLKEKHDRAVHLLKLEINGGKANAVRQGVKTASRMSGYLYLGYMDADLATPLSQIELLRKYLNNSPKQFAFGSRVATLNADIKRSKYRHYSGRVIATLISVELGLPIYDTQCGMKLFTSDIVEPLFNTAFVSNWLFDVELFHRINSLNNPIEEIAVEVPLDQWIEKGGSKITIVDMFKVPVELYRIHRKYNQVS